MKKYIFIFVVLLAVGTTLGYFFYQKYQTFNSAEAKLIQDYVQQLDRKDRNLNIRLMKLGFGIDNQYDDIVKLVNSLKQSNRELGVVLDSVDSHFEPINEAYQAYQNLYAVKLDLVESFKTNNSALLNSANFAPYLGSVLVGKLNKEELIDDANELSNYNAELIQYIRKAELSSKSVLDSELSYIREKTKRLSGSLREQMEQYGLHVAIVLKHLEPTKQYLAKTTEVATGAAIENMIDKVNQKRKADFQALAEIRIATIGFCIIVFLAFLIFLVKMRQLFFGKGTQAVMTLNEKIEKITNEIKGPLGFLNNNLNSINSSFGSIRGTVEGFDNVIKEIKKPTRDNAKVSEIMSKTLREYNSMHNQGTMEKTHNMIVGTSVGVEEISNLITVLQKEAEKEM